MAKKGLYELFRDKIGNNPVEPLVYKSPLLAYYYLLCMQFHILFPKFGENSTT